MYKIGQQHKTNRNQCYVYNSNLKVRGSLWEGSIKIRKVVPPISFSSPAHPLFQAQQTSPIQFLESWESPEYRDGACMDFLIHPASISTHAMSYTVLSFCGPVKTIVFSPFSEQSRCLVYCRPPRIVILQAAWKSKAKFLPNAS